MKRNWYLGLVIGLLFGLSVGVLGGLYVGSSRERTPQACLDAMQTSDDLIRLATQALNAVAARDQTTVAAVSSQVNLLVPKAEAAKDACKEAAS